MRLRPVTLDDVPLFERLRTDPNVMAELGGPPPPEGIPDKVRRDVALVEQGLAWNMVFVGDDGRESGDAVHVETGRIR